MRIRKSIIISIILVAIALSFAAYAVISEYEWQEGRFILNPACDDSLLSSKYRNGVYFYSINHSIDDVTGIYYFNASLKNTHGTSKNISYEWFACRCQEHDGNAWDNGPICLGFWPDMDYTGSGNYLTNCLGLGKQNITLASYEQKNISFSKPHLTPC